MFFDYLFFTLKPKAFKAALALRYSSDLALRYSFKLMAGRPKASAAEPMAQPSSLMGR